MSSCLMCGAHVFRTEHAECMQEMNARYSMGKCIKCGGRNIPDGDPYRGECRECAWLVGAPYVGYPPGAA